ncbi:hypothetical protein [Coleofasciculus sp. F4-SAH-05]|uniref:hypothetical protein n=1 Tax=Coleofasciculus sp. F4-SAH-05 TaxID=3069525 RepID=UPI0032FD241B
MSVTEIVAICGIAGAFFQGFWMILDRLSKNIKQQVEVEKRLGHFHCAILDKLENQDKKIARLENEVRAYRISNSNADWLGLPPELREED